MEPIKKIINTIVADVTRQPLSEVMNITSKILKDLISVSITTNEQSMIYSTINKLLYKFNPVLYNKHRCVSCYDNYYELEVDTLYFINLHNGNFIKVTMCEIEEQHYNSPRHLLKLDIFGPDMHCIKKYITKKCVMKNKNKTTIMLTDRAGAGWSLPEYTFKNIIMDNRDKLKIISGIKNWMQRENWYAEHGLVYKIGILVYGNPGTGKTSLSRCISKLCGDAPIVVVNQKNIDSSIDRIHVEARKNQYLIVLIEDVDFYFKTRKLSSKDTKDIDSEINDNQNKLFQLLDGVCSTERTIFIATTNHIDHLDPALIRNGRFDIKIEMRYFDFNQSLQFVKMFGFDEQLLNNKEIKFPVAPVELQAIIMEENAKMLTGEIDGYDGGNNDFVEKSDK